MLRVVEDDPIKRLYTAYIEARRTHPEFAESLKDALRVARRTLPEARRPYDLSRRCRRALDRFQRVSQVHRGGEPAEVVPLPQRKMVRIFPDQPSKIGA